MIQTLCRGCGQQFTVKDDLAGKRVRCPGCGDPVPVPLPGEAPARPPVPVPPPHPAPMPPPRATPVPAPRPPPRPAAVALEQPAAPPSPTAAFADLDTGGGERTPRKRSKSPAQRGAGCVGFVGAVVGVVLMALLGPSAAEVLDAINQATHSAKGLNPEVLPGVIVGFAGGLLAGCLLMAVAGRTLEAVSASLVLMLAGAVYGGFRHTNAGEVALVLLLAGALAGILAGAAAGALVGVIIGAIMR